MSVGNHGWLVPQSRPLHRVAPLPLHQVGTQEETPVYSPGPNHVHTMAPLATQHPSFRGLDGGPLGDRSGRGTVLASYGIKTNGPSTGNTSVLLPE